MAVDLGSEDRHLAVRAQGGDLAAFETLYRRNVGRTYALCLRISADPVRAEELTQSAFVQAWERLSSYRGESAFSTWLHRLTVNIALEDRRSKKRWSARETAVEDLSEGEAPSPAASPDEKIDIERAIASLPAGARTAFVLHDVEGYRHEEIAEMAGLAPGTVKAQLHRARNLLRKALER